MPQFFPAAPALTETETVEILTSGLKKRIYPDATTISETESMVTELGLKWFLQNDWLGQAETEATAKATALISHFPISLVEVETETTCRNLAIWPEPPVPIVSVSSAGKDLHKQSLKHGSSHQISLTINCEETTIEAVNLLQIIFEITSTNGDVSFFRKTRFGAPGGIILDIIKDQAEGKILMLADLQLRPSQISFSGTESEFDFAVIVENSTINQRAEVARGTLILSKD